MIPERVKEVWDRYNLNESVRNHCIAVEKLALEIARNVKENGTDVDLDAVKLGALLHDIGRAFTHDPFQHFIKSAEILRKEGFDEKIVKIAERHFSAGLRADEAKRLGLPEKDFMPQSIEEKIVSLSDNLVNGNSPSSFDAFMRRLDEIDRKHPEMVWLTDRTRERARKLKEEIEKLSGMKF
jgi:uncharacterized protein (TIGR00295 family)